MDQTTKVPPTTAALPTTISQLGLDCQRHFITLIDTLRRVTGELESELSTRTVEDELGRFRVWASNIGAMTSGRASMDYRMRNAGYLRENVKSLLEDLKQSLGEGPSSLEGC